MDAGRTFGHCGSYRRLIKNVYLLIFCITFHPINAVVDPIYMSSASLSELLSALILNILTHYFRYVVGGIYSLHDEMYIYLLIKLVHILFKNKLQ